MSNTQRPSRIARRALALLAATGLALGGLPAQAWAAPAPLEAQDDSLAQSGLTSTAKPTLSELSALYAEIPAEPQGMERFSVAPDVGAYVPGVLSDSSLAFCEAYLKLVRRSANLGPVTLSGEANSNAAQGALILARLDGGLTHYPSTPGGVSEEQAAPGKYACSASNLSGSWGIGGVLSSAIQGQLDDDDTSNMDRLGHRRWLLNPAASSFGIGSATAPGSGWSFTAVRVFNRYDADPSYGRVGSDGPTSYDFIAWPASGAFLSELFSVGTPWSVTLNPQRYQTPDASQVRVRMVRESDGKTWDFGPEDSTVTQTGEYFNVDTGGYGVANCIIFNPGPANLGASAYDGAYRVTVTGIRTADGQAATLSYEVDFARAVDPVPTPEPDPTPTPDPDPTPGSTPEPDPTPTPTPGTDDPSVLYPEDRDYWVVDEAGDWYVWRKGKLRTSTWVELNGDWYYLGADGRMLVGLQELAYAGRTERYYFNPYHDGSYGKMSVGWLYADGSWWLLNPAHDGSFGCVLTGWQRSGGSWYWLGTDGRMATGWRRVGGSWYWFDASGAMATGWRQLGGTWYYFHPSGAMAANEWVGSSWVDATGAWRG